jgi:ABC-type transport system substrate-binding protein
MNGLTRRGVLAGGAAAALATDGRSSVARADEKHTLVIASGQDIPNFDPHVATGYSGSFALRNLYDTLVRVQGDPPKIVPGIAKSWERSADGLEFVFHLDPDAKFQDGSPIDAEAVRYSFNRLSRLNKAMCGWSRASSTRTARRWSTRGPSRSNCSSRSCPLDLLRKSGEFPLSNEELNDAATTVYEGI